MLSFASVAQKAIRRVACSVYEHLLRLDLSFHLSRQTGGLTRAIDRGTKGISFLLTSMVFHIVPTALEISLVCGILVSLAMECQSSATDLPSDLPIWLALCRHHRFDHDGLLRFHHINNIMANQIQETSECSR